MSTTNAEQSVDLTPVIQTIISDISGMQMIAGGLLRHVPKLAAQVDALEIPGERKRDLVMEAIHQIVRSVAPEDALPTVLEMVDAIVPPAIAGVIDVARGRVSFQKAVAVVAPEIVSNVIQTAPEVAEVASGCLPLLFSCMLQTSRAK